MAAPINTYNSLTNLSLGNVPQVDDPQVYRALLDIHNALEILLTASDDYDAIFAAFIAKFRNVTAVSADYTVLATDGLVIVDITAGNVTITLPTGVDFTGYQFEIAAVADSIPSVYTCTIIGEGGALVDNDAGGITIDALEAVPFKYDYANDRYIINN